MNTTFKRSVAAFLTAGMLLTGLTACFKSPEEKRGDEITELANQESEIKFDMIVYVNITNRNMYVIGKVQEENSDENKYMELVYKLSTEDAEKVFNISNNHDIFYPFNTESSDLIKEIMSGYEPTNVIKSNVNDTYFDMFDQLVEEYCK